MSTAGDAPHKSDADHIAAVLQAALPEAAREGFTEQVLKSAAHQAGVDDANLLRLFPQGALSLVETFSQVADQEMKEALARQDLAAMRIRDRIAAAVWARLDALRPHKEAARRAAAFLTLPPHAGKGVNLLWQTADAMWRAAGDTATDFNFYSKRAILMAVYSSTLVCWFNDESADEQPTRDFLNARIGDVMRFEKFKADTRNAFAGMPSFTDIINNLQRGRSSPPDA